MSWDATTSKYKGDCGAKQIACPANAVYNKAGVCVCSADFNGQITWNAAKRNWNGKCTPKPCQNVRKEWRQMSANERSLYLEAVARLSLSGAYVANVVSHYSMSTSENAYAHRSHGLFPWHRIFIFRFENALRALGGKYRCVNLPYYDWSSAGTGFVNSAELSAFGGSFSGCLSRLGGNPFGFSCVTRAVNTNTAVAGSASVYGSIRSSGSLSGLYSGISASHNAVHTDVGGTMYVLEFIICILDYMVCAGLQREINVLCSSCSLLFLYVLLLLVHIVLL